MSVIMAQTKAGTVAIQTTGGPLDPGYKEPVCTLDGEPISVEAANEIFAKLQAGQMEYVEPCPEDRCNLGAGHRGHHFVIRTGERWSP